MTPPFTRRNQPARTELNTIHQDRETRNAHCRRQRTRCRSARFLDVCVIRPELLLGSGPGFVEAEDCQIRAGTRLVFHQLPTSPLGQLFEFPDREEQVVEPASSHVPPASAETNLTRKSAMASIAFVVSQMEWIISGEGVDTGPDNLSPGGSHFGEGAEEAEAMRQALQKPVVVAAQQEGVKRLRISPRQLKDCPGEGLPHPAAPTHLNGPGGDVQRHHLAARLL